VKKSNKKFKVFRVIIIVHSHYFIILKLFRVVKGFILYQIKQTTLKSDYNFTSYGKFTDTSRIEELQTQSPIFPIWVSSSISKKRHLRVLNSCVTNVALGVVQKFYLWWLPNKMWV